MSLFDSLKGALGGQLGRMAADALPGLIREVLPGGLAALTEQLRRSGYETQVNSWLGRGPNQPITADDLRGALDNAQVRAMAERLGVPVDQLFPMLAQALPEAVDHHSPDGTLREPGA